MQRKEVKGNAAGLTLSAPITGASAAGTYTGTDTGWPTGVSFPFVCVIDRNTASEEKILCSLLSAGTITFQTRGYDGTTAGNHSAGAIIEHCLDAKMLEELMKHVGDTTTDDHSQYIKADGTRAFAAVSAIAGAPVSIGTANAAGGAVTLARSDHVHAIGAGAINANTMFANGVLNLLTKFANPTLPMYVCTSGTRPAHNEGQPIYETDTDRIYVSDGANWKWIWSSAHEDHVVVEGSATADASVASPAWGNFGPALSVTVPPWATQAIVRTTAMCKSLTGGVTGAFRTLIDAAAGGSHSYDAPFPAAFTVSFVDAGITVTPGATSVVQLQGNRSITTGLVRTGAPLTVSHEVTFQS